VGKIFSTRLLRIKFFSRRKHARSRFYYVPDKSSAKWKRAFVLAPVLVGLFFVTMMDPGGRAISKALKTKIVNALKDPLALFGDRSPGGRRPGALLSTKANLAPHERVLSTIREREPSLDIPPGVDTPIFPAAPEALQSPSADELPGPPASGPPFSNSPFFYPGPPPPTGLSAPPPGTPPGTPPDTPPGIPPGIPPDTPPGTPPTTTPPGTIPVPEPATWLILGLGILAIGAAARRRRST